MSYSTQRTPTTASGSTTLSINVPSGVVNGDFLYLVLTTKGASSSRPIEPAGWTVDSSTTFGGFATTAYYRTASSEPASYTAGPGQNFSAGSPAFTDIVGVMLAFAAGDITGAHSIGTGVSFNPGTTITFGSSAAALGAMGAVAIHIVSSYHSTTVPATGWTPNTGYSTAASIAIAEVSLEVETKDCQTSDVYDDGASTVLNASSRGTGTKLTFNFLRQRVAPVGVAATGTVGAGFAIQVGANLSFTMPAVSAAGQVGAPGFETFYARGSGNEHPQYGIECPFVGAVPGNAVRLGIDGLAATGIVGVVSAGIKDKEAFQQNAFQQNAFQTGPFVYVGGLQATGMTGSVVIVPPGVVLIGLSGFGQLGSPTLLFGPEIIATGVQATGQLGSISFVLGTGVDVTGLQATGYVGVPVFHWDMVFNWPPPNSLYWIVYPHGRVGSVAVTGSGNVSPAGVQAVGQVGTVVYQSSVSPAGLQASGALGAISVRVDYSFAAPGLQALSATGNPTYASFYEVTGVQATTMLGTPIVSAPTSVPELGVQAAGGVGAIGFQIGGSVSPLGLQAQGLLGAAAVRVDVDVPAVGLQATTQVGQFSGYGAIAGVQANTQVGTCTVRVDCSLYPASLVATGQVGSVGDSRSSSVAAPSMTAQGLVGVSSPYSQAAFDAQEMIYTRPE